MPAKLRLDRHAGGLSTLEQDAVIAKLPDSLSPRLDLTQGALRIDELVADLQIEVALGNSVSGPGAGEIGIGRGDLSLSGATVENRAAGDDLGPFLAEVSQRRVVTHGRGRCEHEIALEEELPFVECESFTTLLLGDGDVVTWHLELGVGRARRGKHLIERQGATRLLGSDRKSEKEQNRDAQTESEGAPISSGKGRSRFRWHNSGIARLVISSRPSVTSIPIPG